MTSYALLGGIALLGLTGVYVWLLVSPDVWEYTLVTWQ